jgi:hypothetical protein
MNLKTDGLKALRIVYEPSISVPPLPDDAPHEQVMDFAAVAGACTVGMHPQTLRRIARAYMDRWHP